MTGLAKTSTRATAFVALALLAACTQGSSQIETASMLPRPQVVVVQDFAVWPGEVQLDPGLSGTIDETLGANRLPPRTAKEQQIGQQVANALAEKLVVEIRDLGLPAERGSGLPPGMATGLVISGQFVSVDQGNRTERVVLGLGAGRSDVRVRAQVFDVSRRGPYPRRRDRGRRQERPAARHGRDHGCGRARPATS